MVANTKKDNICNITHNFGGLENIKEYASDEFIDSLFSKEIPDVEYDPFKLPIGYSVRTGRPYRIDTKEACRMIFLGMTRTGKTWCIRRLQDITYKAGDSVVHLNDCKCELGFSNSPLQKEFHHLLMKNEKPQSTPVVTFRPTFFKQLMPINMAGKDKDKRIRKNNYWYSIDSAQITQGDFNDLVRFPRLSLLQQSVMDDIYKQMMGHIQEGNEFDVEYLFEIIDGNEDLKKNDKLRLNMYLKPLKSAYFFDTKWKRSIVETIAEDKFVPSFNLEDFDKFSKDGVDYVTAFLSIVHRELVSGCRTGKFNRLWCFIDESARILNIENPTNFLNEIYETIELNTRYNINYVFAYQDWNSIPPRILSSCRYIFVPANADPHIFKEVMKRIGKVRNEQIAYNEGNRLKRRMNPETRDWLVVDTFTSKLEIIRSYAPLSHHATTGEQQQ